MSNFKYKVAMKVTKEQQDELVPKLIELGYEIGSLSRGSEDQFNILTNYDRTISHINIFNRTVFPYYFNIGEYKITEYNLELFLALCAVHDNNELHIGELCRINLPEFFTNVRGTYNNQVIKYIHKFEQEVLKDFHIYIEQVFLLLY